MGENCISFAAWMPHALLAAAAIGMLVGFGVAALIANAELISYRRLARRSQ